MEPEEKTETFEENDSVRMTRQRMKKAIVVMEKSTVEVQSQQNGRTNYNSWILYIRMLLFFEEIFVSKGYVTIA